ncbi:uncharacterized protein si:dkeyp-51f12.3 [Mugil cephalus]|uniref:uncharacterized protein si:dkeyp-51f12.3 n=1 Tax=Mugil cephalus TaxID=48193 RepID=UPI001FB59560|nr:uncharacterized protein si:dkeyp-51f12.3 [Mugil cephalus]XP_047444131.1 uncharacterized protein si:dkeyp-51f12.3 [Mugil cephalus]
MPVSQGTLIYLGVLLITAGAVMIFGVGLHYQSVLLFIFGLLLGLGGIGLLISGLCMAKRNLQVAVPGHFLLHPRTGTRFSPQQALAIQRRLDRIRREMSADSVSRTPDPEPSLPSTPPPWTMEPPPSYDTVMKSQEQSEQL